MGKKKVHHEEHVDETWLIPYADMLTLLLALFIVMFAMSQVDKEKLKKTSEQFNIIFAGGSGMLEQNASDQSNMSVISSNSLLEEGKMNEVKKTLEKEISSTGYADKIKVGLNKDGLEISIQDVVLFNSGEAAVLKEVSPLLTQISKMLSTLDNNIKVTGHTDDKPISNEKFRSNWDLSAIRAINVMNFMVKTGEIHPQKLSIQAYGEYMPKFNNLTEEGKAKNRRVEIFIIRKYPVTEGDKKK